MNRIFAVFAATLAALALTMHAAQARPHKRIDPRLDAASTGVGAASTAGYFAWVGDTHGAAGALTTVGCAAASPIVATAVLNRPLTYREAHILIASCVIPIVGGWLVNEAYNEGWLWAPDEKPVRKVHYRHHRRKN